MDKGTRTQGTGSIEMCPMASMCKGMAGKPGFGLLLIIPGLLLILGGVLILIEPRVLVWLMASTSILIGVVMLFLAMFVRKISVRFKEGGG
jgi:hypothetical protein